MLDPCGKVGDLRRTLAQLSGVLNGRPGMRNDFNNLVEEQEESDGRAIFLFSFFCMTKISSISVLCQSVYQGSIPAQILEL